MDMTDFTPEELEEVIQASRKLNGANLVGIDLRGADLRTTRLDGADLRDANLRGADLSSAYLSAAYLGAANLTGAKYDKDTKVSQRFRPRDSKDGAGGR
jgi:uncharacterized protein YjbI with pentapeptide repeats